MDNRFLFDAISAIVLFVVAAGVMLSAGFCHLLAEALPKIHDKVKKFPLGTFLCAAGYVLTLVADEVAVAYTQHDHGTPNNEKSSHAQKGRNEKRADVFEIETADLMVKTGLAPSDGRQDRVLQSRVSFVTAVLLGAALSLHSILEGLALGSQTTLHSSENIMLAIFAHKGLAAYALGASLVDSQTSTKRFWMIVLGFAIASPLGIMMGYGISSFASGIVSASLSALASGTFLYVATMEVLPKELANPAHKVEKISAMLFGFTAMSLLAIWA